MVVSKTMARFLRLTLANTMLAGKHCPQKGQTCTDEYRQQNGLSCECTRTIEPMNFYIRSRPLDDAL